MLIGVGDDISREQMEELDDLDTNNDVDIWDHKIVAEMRSLVEIFAEVVSEHQIVAPMGIIYDDQDNVVRRFSDGMPALVKFEMDRASKFFDLVVGEHRIRQSVDTV